MRSPIYALIWETWRQKRGLAATAASLVALGWIFNLVVPEGFRAAPADRERCAVVSFLLATATIGLVFGIFNYTESSPQRDWTGFPYRLFTLPVTSLTLVLAPMLLGVVSVELAYLAALKLIFMRENVARSEWLAVLLGCYMVFYQTILWSLAGFRILRMIILGSVGVSFIGVAFLPFYARYIPSPWLSEKVLSIEVGGLAVAAFLVAWCSVARQRHGGGRRRSLWSAVAERITDALPGRTKAFNSPQAAHFWFEWRRSGWILPGCVAAAVVLVITPLSVSLRNDPGLTL